MPCRSKSLSFPAGLPPAAATFAALALAMPALADRLDIERVHADPPLAGTIPRSIVVAPDGARVSFLRPRDDDQDILELWQIEPGTGVATRLLGQEDLVEGAVELTAEEEALRQRLRIRAGGITGYRYDETGRRLLIPLAGGLYIFDFDTETVTAIDDGEARLDPKLSPSGDAVAFVRDRNLWIRELDSGAEQALTGTGSDTVVNGQAEFIAQEEMGRYDGFWWSPDGRRIAFIEYDESPVQIQERVAIGGDGATLTTQRYPLAGTDNVSVRVGIAEPGRRRTRWVDLGPERDIYIPRVQWSDDGSRLYVQRQSRSQATLDLLAVDPADGSARLLIREAATSWINLDDDFRPLADGRFLWTSERTGFRHIYLFPADGGTPTALTHGEWLVDEIDCVDAEAGQVYFTGWIDDPLTADLYRVGLDGTGAPERVSIGNGMHSIAAAADCSIFVDTFSAPDQPPQVALYSSDGSRIAWLLENRLDADHPYAPYLDTHVVPEFGTLEAEDGTLLHYALYRPSDFDPERQYPAIVQVYGGPMSQQVTRGWGPASAQVYADEGYIVFVLDNRGSARRGTRFENTIHRRLGDIETRDQLRGIRFLGSLPYVDAARIGVTGWSYGGYMSLMLLARSEGLVAAAVAGAPVTDWRLYDTHYTERYLGLPAENDAGYERSAVFPYLDGIDGALLLVHGMADDNVFFTNSTKLMQALQQSNIAFELMTYPGETHFIRNRASRLHSDRTALAFFERYLGP